MAPIAWQLRDRILHLGPRPEVMGIVNVTPDSFSDGGDFLDPPTAIAQGLQLVADGATILDVGGESSRPRSTPVSVEEELRRVLPVVPQLARQVTVPISIDTVKPEIARRCLDARAHIINDIRGFRDPEMIAVAAESRAGVVVMHMQGEPATMQQNPHYVDVVCEVREFFDQRLHELEKAGIPRNAMCLDPGMGFGKSLEHNLELLANLGEFAPFGRPICLGVSRKGFIGTLCGRTVEERMPGSLAVASFAIARGSAQVLRVHDVAPTRDAAVLLVAIDRYRR